MSPRFYRLYRNLSVTLGLGLVILAAAAGHARAQASELWFTPIEGIRASDGKQDWLPEFFQLFTPEAPWSEAASHVRVFKLYINLIDVGNADQLHAIFQNLQERHMALAVEYSVLDSSPQVGERVEGFFAEPAHAEAMAYRIKAHGGRIDYIAMDEPCWFGANYSGKNAAHWPIEKIADNAVRTMRIIQSVFPAVQLGDIEPVQDQSGPNLPAQALIDQYSAWVDAVQSRWGKPLAFFHCDVIWTRPYQTALRGLQAAMAQRHVPFGIIYNGSGLSPHEWFASAQQHYEDIENNGGRAPDQAVFQSWNPLSARLLPENEPDTHTHLVLTYLRSRMTLTATRNDPLLTASLHDAAGHALAGVPVTMDVLHRGEKNGVYEMTFSGLVPAKAVSAGFGLRINLETIDTAPVDVDLKAARYEEAGKDPQTFEFWNVGAFPGDEKKARREIISDDGEKVLHLIAAPAQGYQLNTPPRFAITPGASFHFSLPYVLHGPSRGTPGAGLFFFDSRGIETTRVLRALEPLWSHAATAITNAQGEVSFTLPSGTPPSSQFRLEFPGDSAHSAVRFELP